ncbi:DUF5682 family protein [Nocardia crassostreae]|uniref:DUF5682 family protein n=1 Tax=Nocardia crassostreae TaxID=53428 RepID=UPI001C3FCCE3|nr:DUF5682 family protein [Nocardia crassostreae]
MVAALTPQESVNVARAVRLAGAPGVLGDFLAGLFALAREQLMEDVSEISSGTTPLLSVLDELVGGFGAEEFLVALPALRLAFAWFPPRERAQIGSRLLEMRGITGSGSTLLRLPADAGTLARARAVEERVDRMLAEHGLLEHEHHASPRAGREPRDATGKGRLEPRPAAAADTNGQGGEDV